MNETPKQHLWYYNRQSLLHGGEYGPFTEPQMLELAKLGKIQLDTLLRSPTKTNNHEILAESIPKLTIAINQAKIDSKAKRLADIDQRKKEQNAIADQKQIAKQEITIRKKNEIQEPLENLVQREQIPMQIDTKIAPDQLDWTTEYKRIAKESGDDMFFTRKELNYLPKIMGQGEKLLAFSSGLMDGNTWLISLTNRRIIFLDKGMIYGLKQASIDLASVNAISSKTGIIFGTIKIENGASEREITMVPKWTVASFTNKVRDAVEATKVRSSQPTQEDTISKLERLSSLKEKGVISQKEFEIEKAKILAN